MNSAFVTGGTGYVGAHIAQALSQAGASEVRVGTRRNLSKLAYLPDAKPVQINFDDVEQLAAAMTGCEVVFHLAAANEIICGQNPVEAIRANITHGLNVLTAAKKAGVRRFFNFSTAHVYGKLEGLITEENLPAPMHPYAITHLGFEGFVSAAMARGEIEGINLRLSNSFGAPLHADVDRWTLIANDICRQVATRREIVLKSDGSQLRDFIPLTDVANICMGLMQLDAADLDNGVFNLGGGKALSVLQLAEAVSQSAKRILGEEIPVKRPVSSGTHSLPAQLTFSIEKLSARDLRPQQLLEDEVDNLLLACLNFFDEKR